MNNHWTSTAKRCTQCNKIRPSSRYIDDSGVCSTCKFDGIIQSEYTRCMHCVTWFSTTGFKHCPKCREMRRCNSEAHARKCGKLPPNTRLTCQKCQRNLSIMAFFTSRKDKCRRCINEEIFESEGKIKCEACRCYRPEECFEGFKRCIMCRMKNRRKWHRDYDKWKDNPAFREAESQRALAYYHAHKEERQEYRRYYYWNVHKIAYHKLLAVQWAYDLAKPKKTNRNGYWYVLNRQLFGEFKWHFGKIIRMQNKIIEFLQTGRGRIVGDQVIIDNPDTRKKHAEYCDSDEGMEAQEKPIYKPKKVKASEYFDDSQDYNYDDD